MSKLVYKMITKESVPAVERYLNGRFDQNPGALDITIENAKSTRSLSQNGKFHVWCYLIAQQIGSSQDSVKADLKAQFLPEIEGLHGVMRTKGTHELTETEMAEFMTQIEVLAVDFGWSLEKDRTI